MAVVAAVVVLMIVVPGASAQDISSTLRRQLSTVLPQLPCVKVFRYGGDSVGCGSTDAGTSGILSAALTQDSLDRIISSKPANGDSLVVLIPPVLMTHDAMASLSNCLWVAGVVSLPGPIDSATGFSPAAAVPAPGGLAWNAAGRDLLSLSFPFSIISVDNATATDLLSKAAVNAGIWSTSHFVPGGGLAKHAMFSYFPMGPTGMDTPTCLGQGSCQPVGGQSSWSTLGPLSGRPTVWAVTGQDATAMFHDLAVGADAAASGMVALLAAAAALGAETSSFTLPLQPAFGVFQGDNMWGRLGSRRFLAEAASFVCNAPVPASSSGTGSSFCSFPPRADLTFLNLSTTPLAAVISVDQVGHPGTGVLTLHPGQGVMPGGGGLNPIAAVMAALSGGSTPPLPLPVTPSTLPGEARPPTSLDSWEELGWPGPAAPVAWYGGYEDGAGGSTSLGYATAILAGYDTSYSSKFYGGRFDDANNVDANVVTAAATALARVMYALCLNLTDASAAAAAVPASVQANATLVSAWLQCLTADVGCPTFASLLGVDPNAYAEALPENTPPGLYPSVYNQPFLSDSGASVVIPPTYVEAAVRNQLALSTAGLSQRNGTASPACSVSGGEAGLGKRNDRSRAGKLRAPLHVDIAVSDSDSPVCAPPWECIAGVCVRSSAFYHDAYSMAVEPVQQTYGAFTFNQSIADAGSLGPRPGLPGDPVWSEPYWSAGIGASIYIREDPGVEAGMAVAGTVLTVGAVVGARYAARALQEHWTGKSS